ncbi:MAG: TRAP transporter small permease, partial [Paracoccaceae bacterium]
MKEFTQLEIDEIEETFIAILLAAMVIITFINVVLRYGFNSGLIWGLELVTYLFAWLVLFGVSYAVKKTSHLGVDAIISTVSTKTRKSMGIIVAILCIFYAFLLLKGSWDYWANFANLPKTNGRWFPTGFEEMKRTSYRSWYEVNDILMPSWLRWIEPIINYGDTYEKIPRFLPYAILPIGSALLLLRFLQAAL